MIALELAKHKIRANVICPGAIHTKIDQNTVKRNVEREKGPVEFPEGAIPLTGGEPGSPEQIAQLVLFLASDDANLITGTEIWIDEGGIAVGWLRIKGDKNSTNANFQRSIQKKRLPRL